MFAVIRTGGKQYKVAENDVILVEKLPGSAGAEIKLDDVLMIGGKALEIGAPALAKAAVFAEVLEQTRGAKIIVFKKKRRQNYRRKKGHRQDLTALRITGISATGAKPVKKAALKKTEPKKAAPEKIAEKETDAKSDAAGKTAAKAPKKTAQKAKE